MKPLSDCCQADGMMLCFHITPSKMPEFVSFLQREIDDRNGAKAKERGLNFVIWCEGDPSVGDGTLTAALT